MAGVSRFERLPPQVCVLALGTTGLSGLLALWGRVQGVDLSHVPVGTALLALALLALYVMKVLFAPAAAWRDACEPATLSALNAFPATAQQLAVRFSAYLHVALPPIVVVACLSLSLCISARFMLLSNRKSVRPDPSWFPAVFLCGVTNMTTQSAGPAWLRDVMPALFFILLGVYVPLKTIVAYRMFFSQERASVAPNASMNVLMAPASFFTLVHFNSGSPGGEQLSVLLFANSTIFVLITLCMLYKRRSVWAGAFNPSYVAFTFPVASSASAALLATERLPHFAGVLAPFARAWATLLCGSATVVIYAVLFRFLWFLLPILGAPPVPANVKRD